METEEFDCTACGACCTSEVYGGGLFVTVYGIDSDRFGPSELDPESQGCDALRTMSHNAEEVRCIFLRGTLGASCQCTAYDRRPQVCRDFTAGTPECLAARLLKFGGKQQ